ncbi:MULTISPECIES: hypothetical protein [Burkholderia cepacia complex]|uniref:hypothetical protein n=1 Tax=Burkholderia cepacia complex TaxID=87882 RepID=UPI0012BB0025|nr:MULTISPECIES: hypothetical protein [Burkholderia cepacia complex]
MHKINMPAAPAPFFGQSAQARFRREQALLCGALEVKPYRHVEKLGDFGATAVGNVAPVEAQLEASNAVTLV